MELKEATLAEWLPHFFQSWPRKVPQTTVARKDTNIVPEQLARFFSQLSVSLQPVQHDALAFDPWEVANLGCKEIRNTGVLAWLLDPYGSHGFGRLPLLALLQAIRTCNRNDIPQDFNRYCRVQVETNPAGDNSNRVDIEIDADNFFLLIEVKIKAGEQEKQLSRYCFDAGQRAIHRPWAVVFLTPHGNKPLTLNSAFQPEDVPCLSWRQLASSIESSLEPSYRKIMTTDNTSPMSQIAAYSALSFLQRMRQF